MGWREVFFVTGDAGRTGPRSPLKKRYFPNDFQSARPQVKRFARLCAIPAMLVAFLELAVTNKAIFLPSQTPARWHHTFVWAEPPESWISPIGPFLNRKKHHLVAKA